MKTIYTTAVALTLGLATSAMAGITQGNRDANDQAGLNPALAANVNGYLASDAESQAYLHTIDINRTAPSAASPKVVAVKWDASRPTVSYVKNDGMQGMSTFPLNNPNPAGAPIGAQPQNDAPASSVIALPSAAPVGFLTLITIGAFMAVRRILRRVA